MSDYVVVIPTRNRYRLGLRAIRSALTQTDVPAEVFVVDDASDDPRYRSQCLKERGWADAARGTGPSSSLGRLAVPEGAWMG